MNKAAGALVREHVDIADQVRMKTFEPLIMTARVAQDDLEPFESLRQMHFPAARNFLRAHLTMFHRLPGERDEAILKVLQDSGQRYGLISAEVSGVRHLGAGVAYTITSQQLLDVRRDLYLAFLSWLGGQDMQKWQPHITIQNKVDRQTADRLYEQLVTNFQPSVIRITGMDLWYYRGGPWEHKATAIFSA